MVGAPLVGLVKSVASGAGSIASGVAKGIGKAVSGADKEQTAKVAASGAPADENGENAVIGDESSVSEMFGGLDLTKVKSALEDEGPMGPPEEGPKTVYKVMIGVLQGMAQTLLRMEATMKMLLAIEYERVKGIVAQTAQESITQSQTPDEPPGKKRGILGRGKDMLGGAWNKAKDSPTWLKMLGLTGLLLAIKFWKEDLEKAVANILEWFTKAYEYFTADDLTWDKFKTDMTTKFLPKIRDFLFGALDWLWGAIKGVAIEWMFGAKGDKRVRQEAGTAITAQSVLRDVKSTAGGAIEELKQTGGLDIGITGSDKKALSKRGIDDEEFEAIQKQIKDTWGAMLEIYRQSDGRIQWSGIGSMEGVDTSSWMNYTIADIMNTTPIIDGLTYPNWDVLKDIQLMKMGGITKGMTDEKQEEIIEALAKKTTLARQYSNLKNKDLSMYTYDVPGRLDTEEERTAKLDAIQADIDAQDLEIESLGQIFAPTDDLLSITTAVEKSGSVLKNAVKEMDQPGRNPTSIINAPTDNSAKTNITNQTITALGPMNINPTNILLNELPGITNTTGVVA